MGTTYSILCHDCKVDRDLDKLNGFYPVETREEALEASEDIDEFRAVLIVSFVLAHNNHRIEILSEHDLDPDEHPELKEYKKENFWG